MSEITFITGNKKKLEEVLYILNNKFPKTLKTKNLDLPEFQGEIEEICIKKTLTAHELIAGPVLVEDCCLCFHAFKGLPGPYIKSFIDKLGPDGLYQMLAGFEDKSATAICTYGYHSGEQSGNVVLFQGCLVGNIVPPKGPRDFGWCPCFQPEGFDVTLAEMPVELVNKISHRFKALTKLVDYFKTN